MIDHRYATRSHDGLHTWSAVSTSHALDQHRTDINNSPVLEVWEITDPERAIAGQPYMLQLRDDDWDVAAPPPLYRGVRDRGGRWALTSMGGERVDWTYTDAEVVVHASA